MIYDFGAVLPSGVVANLNRARATVNAQADASGFAPVIQAKSTDEILATGPDVESDVDVLGVWGALPGFAKAGIMAVGAVAILGGAMAIRRRRFGAR